MRPRRSAGVAYRRWYAAAGPWAGYFRAVPLVALARGVVAPPDVPPPSADALVATLAATGDHEGWLGRDDVLLLLDLPGPTSVTVAAGLARWGVRPILLSFLWPEPGALLPADRLLAALLHQTPPPRRPSARARPAQYAFVLARERVGPASAAALGTQFDNRYELGAVDLPDAERLRAGGVGAVVACRRSDVAPAPDLVAYLDALEGAALPVRRLVLD